MNLKLPGLSVFALCFIASAFARSSKQDVLAPSTQILVVTTSDWNAVEGTLQRYERVRSSKGWKRVGSSIPVVVGKTGLAWGAGLASSDGAGVRGFSDPVKKEGDGKAPAGVFRLSTTFGYAAEKQSGWRMPYTSLTSTVECVDDASSKFYNRVVDNQTVKPDWNSSEHMLRPDELYGWGLVVDHNADPVTPGSGSCIFAHLARPGPGDRGLHGYG